MQCVSAVERVELLCRLVATESQSGSEQGTADILYAFLAERGAEVNRLHNNVWTVASGFDSAKPTLMLNSHHDTVKPAVIPLTHIWVRLLTARCCAWVVTMRVAR